MTDLQTMLHIPMNMESLTALFTLTAMEIVLGIDNIVFISILVGRLSPKDRVRGRTFGLGLALLTRLLLLFSLTWLMGLTKPWFTLLNHGVSGRDLILLVGGLFLVGKATFEIHHKVEGPSFEDASGNSRVSFISTLIQIGLLDIVFSLDSVITAVGMAQSLGIMVVAVILSMVVMLLAAGTIGEFVDRHPTIKILALAFLVLIGVMLLMEGMGRHVEKGYIYFAMAFALIIELINMRFRKNSKRKRA